MNRTYLLLGSNIGDCKNQLETAIHMIREEVGPVIRASSIYLTKAWGNTDQPDFLNQVIIVDSLFAPSDLLEKTLAIEQKMGRIRTLKNAPRVIDIDILFYNKAIIRIPNLTVPHPEIQNRRFVLAPLNELSPQFIHPVLQQSIHQLLNSCTDALNVKKF